MRLSRKQKAMLHQAPAALGLTDEQRRTIQRNVGGFDSAADATATREGFCAVMAFYEDRSPGRRLRGFTPGYWADAAKKADADPDAALRVALIRRAAERGMGPDELDAFITGDHMSRGFAPDVASASRYWLNRCFEAVKAMKKREADAHAEPI